MIAIDQFANKIPGGQQHAGQAKDVASGILGNLENQAEQRLGGSAGGMLGGLSIELGRPAPFRGRDERRVLVWGRGRVNPLPRPKRLTMTCAYSTLVRVSRGVKDSASTAGLAGSHACGRSM